MRATMALITHRVRVRVDVKRASHETFLDILHCLDPDLVLHLLAQTPAVVLGN